MLAAVDGVIAETATVLGADETGAFSKDTLAEDGINVRQITVAETVALRAALDTLVASID